MGTIKPDCVSMQIKFNHVVMIYFRLAFNLPSNADCRSYAFPVPLQLEFEVAPFLCREIIRIINIPLEHLIQGFEGQIKIAFRDLRYPVMGGFFVQRHAAKYNGKAGKYLQKSSLFLSKSAEKVLTIGNNSGTILPK